MSILSAIDVILNFINTYSAMRKFSRRHFEIVSLFPDNGI